MYYMQSFYGFPYMGGWQQNIYFPQQHMGCQMPMQPHAYAYPAYPQQHIPFNAWAMPQQTAPIRTHSARPPSYRHVPPTARPTPCVRPQPMTSPAPIKTSAYGGNRPRSAVGARKEPPSNPMAPCMSRAVIATPRPFDLPNDVLCQILAYASQPFRLRPLSRLWNSAYLSSCFHTARVDGKSVGGRFRHVQAVIDRLDKAATKEARQLLIPWKKECDELQCRVVKDSQLVAFFQRCGVPGRFGAQGLLEQYMYPWAESQGREKDLQGDVSQQADCIRKWLATNPGCLGRRMILDVDENVTERPQEASLLKRLVDSTTLSEDELFWL